MTLKSDLKKASFPSIHHGQAIPLSALKKICEDARNSVVCKNCDHQIVSENREDGTKRFRHADKKVHRLQCDCHKARPSKHIRISKQIIDVISEIEKEE